MLNLQRTIEVLSVPETISEDELIEKLRGKALLREDCLYFCFARPERARTKHAHLIQGKPFSLERMFKVELSEGTVKLEYHGPVDAWARSLVRAFFRDFEAFMAEKFPQKCMARFLLGLKQHGSIFELSDKAGGLMPRAPANEVALHEMEESQVVLESKVERQLKQTAGSEDSEIQVGGANFYRSQTLSMRSSKSSSRASHGNDFQIFRSDSFTRNLTTEGPPNKEESLLQKCKDIIQEINEPNATFSFRRIENSPAALKVYLNFLCKYAKYKSLRDQRVGWSEMISDSQMQLWSHQDLLYLTRKATLEARLDPHVLDIVLTDISLIPKWNQTIGSPPLP